MIVVVYCDVCCVFVISFVCVCLCVFCVIVLCGFVV